MNNSESVSFLWKEVDFKIDSARASLIGTGIKQVMNFLHFGS